MEILIDQKTVIEKEKASDEVLFYLIQTSVSLLCCENLGDWLSLLFKKTLTKKPKLVMILKKSS